MTIIEPRLAQSMIDITCLILHNNFFYEKQQVADFCDKFIDRLNGELKKVRTMAEPRFLDELKAFKIARFHFTCHFVSANLREMFITDLHFTDQELNAFEKVLYKYAGERENENDKKHKRTYYREFFK